MQRVAATSAYVRAWLPSVWKRALQRLLHFLLRLSMFPRRLLMLEGSSTPKRRWLRDADVHIDTPTDASTVDDDDDDALFFAADAVSTSMRRGLTNTGNTCFVNAVVQCLLTLPGFVDRLEEEIVRIVEDEVSDTAGTGEPRIKGNQQAQLVLAQTLLDVLKGLLLEEAAGVEQEQESVTDESGPTEMVNGATHKTTNNESQHYKTGKKRKRPMTTSPDDYSAAATTKRLKCFLRAASKCSDLVAGEARRQDQQDAEEFLLFVLDSLHEVMKRTRRAVQPSSSESSANDQDSDTKAAELAELGRLAALENDCLQHLKTCVVTNPETYNLTVAYLGDLRWHRYLRNNASFITDMFTGQIVRGSQCCSCANLTCLHQEFRVLSLNIAPSHDTQTLFQCLEAHRELEDLVADNQVFCDGHCKDKTSRRTQVLLHRAPEALVIQLQRYKQSSWDTRAEKIGATVEFPISEPLDLTGNMFLRDADHPVQYELQGVCAHLGSSLDAGHYIAYTRESALSSPEGGGWNKFDDDFVSTLDAATLRKETQSTAYLLFYTRLDLATNAPEPPVENQSEVENTTNVGVDDSDNI